MFEEGEVVVLAENHKQMGFITEPIGKYDTQARVWWITNHHGKYITVPAPIYHIGSTPLSYLMKSPEIDVIFPDIINLLIDEALVEGNKAEFTRLSKLLGGEVVGQA